MKDSPKGTRQIFSDKVILLLLVFIVTGLLALFARPIMYAFQMDSMSIESSMGGYIASMFGAIMGALLAIVGAMFLDEQKERKEKELKLKTDARILWFAIRSELTQEKAKYIYEYINGAKYSVGDEYTGYLTKETFREINSIILNKMRLSKPPESDSLLSKKQKVEIISSLDSLDFEKQTDLIEYVTKGQAFLESHLCTDKIKNTYKEAMAELYREYGRLLRYVTAHEYLSKAYGDRAYCLESEIEAFISRDTRGFTDFLLQGGIDSDTPQEDFATYILNKVIGDYDLSPSFLNEIIFSPERNIFEYDFGQPIDKKNLLSCMDKLLVWYKKYSDSSVGEREAMHKEKRSELLSKCEVDQSVLDVFNELSEELSAERLDKWLSEWLGREIDPIPDPFTKEGKEKFLYRVSAFICNSYACAKTRWEHSTYSNDELDELSAKYLRESPPVQYRQSGKLSDNICDYFDFELARDIIWDSQEHLKFLQRAYNARYKLVSVMYEGIYRFDAKNDLSDPKFKECLDKIECIWRPMEKEELVHDKS